MFKKVMVLAILFVSLFAVSAVSAVDNVTDDVVSVNSNVNEEVIGDVENEVLNLDENQQISSIDNIEVIKLNDDDKLEAIEKIDNDDNGIEMNPLIVKSGESIVYKANIKVTYDGPGIRYVLLGNSGVNNGGPVLDYRALPENGVATFNIGVLDPGIYFIHARYRYGDYSDATGSAYIQVIDSPITTSLSSSNVITTYKSGKNLVVTLKDKRDYLKNADEMTTNMIKYGYKDTLSGMKVSITVNFGQTKTLTTDKNGQVKLSLNSLKAGRSLVKITFNGDEYYAKSTKLVLVVVHKVTPVIYAKTQSFKAKVKTKNVKITLRDDKDRTIKNLKVTLNINGKTFSAKTNSNGVATFKVTNLNKKGTFKGTIKFAGNNCYKSTSKKISVKIK